MRFADATERLAALAGLLQRDGRVEVSAAADAFGTAEMTIRRDLDRMVAMVTARRVRGGTVSLLMRGAALPFALRALERIDAKRRIAAEVTAQLRDGEAVLLDSGTTAVEVGRAVAGRRLTVMPMSLRAAAALSASHSVLLLARDSSKFRRTALAVVCEATAVDLIVTDSAAPSDAVVALSAAGVEVRCV